MALTETYAEIEPRRAEIDALAGPTLLEFGTAWCGHCQAVQPLLAGAMSTHSHVRHIKIADGPGRRLGRSFGIKLWPTLVFLQDGEEKLRLVRPDSSRKIAQALEEIGHPAPWQ